MNILLVDDDIMLAETTATLIKCTGVHQVYITDEQTEVFRQCQLGNLDFDLFLEKLTQLVKKYREIY